MILLAQDDCRRELSDYIEHQLLESLATRNMQSVNDFFVLTDQDEYGNIQGGVSASTSYGWLLIKTLWVSEDHRRRKIGRALISAAEEQGRHLGCHGVWLETSNPDAVTFYDKLGYKQFAMLRNGESEFPADHRRWFLKKALSV